MKVKSTAIIHNLDKITNKISKIKNFTNELDNITINLQL